MWSAIIAGRLAGGPDLPSWLSWLLLVGVPAITIAVGLLTSHEKITQRLAGRRAQRQADLVGAVTASEKLEERIVEILLINERVREVLYENAHAVLVEELRDTETVRTLNDAIDSLKEAVERVENVFISVGARAIDGPRRVTVAAVDADSAKLPIRDK